MHCTILTYLTSVTLFFIHLKILNNQIIILRQIWISNRSVFVDTKYLKLIVIGFDYRPLIISQFLRSKNDKSLTFSLNIVNDCPCNNDHIWNQIFSIDDVILQKQKTFAAARHVYWENSFWEGYIQYSNASIIRTTYSGFQHI